MIINFYQVGKKNMYISTCGNILKSYDRIIAVKKGSEIYLNADYHDYSKTTAQHRNQFLGVDSKEFHRNLKEGHYILISDEEIIRLVKQEVILNENVDF